MSSSPNILADIVEEMYPTGVGYLLSGFLGQLYPGSDINYGTEFEELNLLNSRYKRPQRLSGCRFRLVNHLRKMRSS